MGVRIGIVKFDGAPGLDNATGRLKDKIFARDVPIPSGEACPDFWTDIGLSLIHISWVLA